MTDIWSGAFAESSRLWGKVAPVTTPLYQVVVNKQVQHFLDRFTNQHRKIVGTWIDRSGQYLGMIRDVLRRHNLPEDLAFTAMVESGFNPLAVSRAGAKGLWQFMAGTARRYGLRVDQWVDERLDPEKSTVAAAAYLRDLHEQFGSWFLAQAAYNAGEVTVAKAIRVTGSTDFWTLTRTRTLRQETKEFVPQILAATMIGRDPGRYGFDPANLQPIEAERVTVPPTTDLRRLSRASGISADTLHALNPVLIRGITPPGRSYDLRVPAGSSVEVLAAVAESRSIQTAAEPRSAPAKKAIKTAKRPAIHVVRARETVTSIARKYGVAVADVLRWNQLDGADRIRPGDRLRVADAHPTTTAMR